MQVNFVFRRVKWPCFFCSPEVTQLYCFHGELYLRKVELNYEFCLYFECVMLTQSSLVDNPHGVNHDASPPPPFRCSTAPRGPRPRYQGFVIHRFKYTTLGRNALDEWSARRRDLSTWQHTTLTKDRHQCLRRDSGQQSQQGAVADRRLWPRRHWVRLHLPLLPLLPFHGKKSDASLPHFLSKFSLHRPDISPFSRHRNIYVTWV